MSLNEMDETYRANVNTSEAKCPRLKIFIHTVVLQGVCRNSSDAGSQKPNKKGWCYQNEEAGFKGTPICVKSLKPYLF